MFRRWKEEYMDSLPEKGYSPDPADVSAAKVALGFALVDDFRRAVQDAGEEWSAYRDRPELEEPYLNALVESELALRGSIDLCRDELNAIRVGDTPTDAKDIHTALTEKFDYYAGPRAQMIARTLTTANRTRAQRAAWEVVSVVTGRNITPVWISQRDALVRHSHFLADGSRPNAGGYFEIEGAFGTVLMIGPGVGGDVAEVANCRCALRPG